ncbi:MAG: hypothetical protein JO159_14755 [Acidobacteria bacterium]|nr:hypothetical protein [Acidobacteriota bacterium]
MAKLKLDDIGSEQVAQYASERQRDGLQISSINSCLHCLRLALKLAEEPYLSSDAGYSQTRSS